MISLKNVTKKYGDFYAISNVSFDIQKGEIVGLLGRNGAGKTTIMNMMTNYIEPTEGEIYIDGKDLTLNNKELKKKIGYMPEGTPLYLDMTVKEYIRYMAELKLVPRKERKGQIESVIEKTGLYNVQKNLIRNLSKGYKQRVSFAGAIIGNPEILILDEPTVGLDPKQVVEIRNLIKSFKDRFTVIISSHILSEITQMCEKVIIIDKGELIAIDSPQNLEKDTEKKEELKKLTIKLEKSKDINTDINNLKMSIKEIENIELISNKDDTELTYEISYKGKSDIRKKIISCATSYNIDLLEISKENVSLENTFIKLIEDRKEYSHDEYKKEKFNKEIEEIRNEEIYKKEEKNRKKAAKETKKLEKEKKKQEEKKEGEE